MFITNATTAEDNGYFFNYVWTNISEASFEQYIAELDSRKLYTTGVDIKPTDKILTLSTCLYEFDNARLVVVARMVRDGESEEVDTRSSRPTPTRDILRLGMIKTRNRTPTKTQTDGIPTNEVIF